MSNTGTKDAETPHMEPTAGGTGRKKASTLALSVHGPSGPRTQRGKQKSRSNAVKHGIFAVGLLRGGESRAEYNALVDDLAESLRPVGKFEEILVEKLVTTPWRYRRFLQAEAAEIEMGRLGHPLGEFPVPTADRRGFMTTGINPKQL